MFFRVEYHGLNAPGQTTEGWWEFKNYRDNLQHAIDEIVKDTHRLRIGMTLYRTEHGDDPSKRVFIAEAVFGHLIKHEVHI